MVIGSSFISMELVLAVAKKKLESIDVIGRGEFPFETILGKEIGAGLKQASPTDLFEPFADTLSNAQYHESQGVKFHMSAKVEKIIPLEDNPKLAGAVVVNGESIPADFVIMGVGVSPATAFLKDSGLELEPDGGIQVDKYLRVTKGPNLDDVYAIGERSTI